MKIQAVPALIAVLTLSLSCQTLFPATPPPRDGVVVTTCPDLVKAVRGIQPVDFPEELTDTGVKQGGEFDANEYFTVLTNLSMREGYILDYIYPVDFLGSFPILAARPVDLPPYVSPEDLPSDSGLTEYLDYVEIEDNEQGYFEFISLYIMANQFYLVWHANYNDTEIVCNRDDVDEISEQINSGGFGLELDTEQKAKIRAMTNIEPLVKLTDTTAIVEIVTFTKWGGFYRMTYTIDRSFPHEIIDSPGENLVPYDCGIMF